MNNFEEMKKQFQALKGTIIIAGEIDKKMFSIFDKNSNFDEVFYLNCSVKNDNSDYETGSDDVASNMHLKDLHKYFKEGVDNIWCNYGVIKDHIPAFVRESLRITKKNIYIFFDNKKDYKKIEKKYKRYNLNCNFYSIDNYNFIVVEANDILINSLKETYYYFIDNIENIYNYICNYV